MIGRERNAVVGFVKRSLVWWSVLLCVLFVTMSQASAHKFRGYAETRYTYIHGLDFGDLCKDTAPDTVKALFKTLCNPHILINRVLPSFLVPFGRKARVRVTANLTTTHFRLAREINKIDDILALQRMYFDLRTKYVDFRLGLQAIQWGPAQLWRLTAPFNPQDVTDPNAEIPGVWAITSYVGYTATGGFRLGIMAAPDFKSMLSFVRWNHTFGTNQLAATVLYDGQKKRMTFGVDVKGNLEVGFWVDAALYVPYEAARPEDMWVSGAVAVGIDYSFKVLQSLYLSLQYYYNYSGFTNPDNYPFKTAEGLQKIAEQFNPANQANINVTGIGISGGGFLAAHYLLFNARLSILEELSVSAIMLMNLIDPSALVGPSVAWTFLDNFTLTAGAYFFLGPPGSEFNVGRIKLPESVASNLPGYPSEGLAISPSFVLFGWLRYNF